MSKVGAAVAVFALAAVGAFAVPTPVAAQESDVERARSEFKEGVALLKLEQWADAEEHLRVALQLRSSPVIRHNLALALTHGGKVVEALRLLDEVLADPGAKESLLAQATSLRDETAPRVAYIELNVRGDTEGVVIKFDDDALDDDALSRPIPADAGSHEFVAHRGDAEITSASVRLTEGSTVSLDLNLPAVAEPTPPPIVPTPAETARATPPPQPTQAHTEGNDDGLLASPWFWAGTGAVVVGVIITAVVLGGDDDPTARPPTMGTLDTIPIGD